MVEGELTPCVCRGTGLGVQSRGAGRAGTQDKFLRDMSGGAKRTVK
jgi:hypothetical protein